MLLISSKPRVFEPEEIPVGGNNRCGSAIGVVDKLAEIIFVVFLEVLVDVEVVIIVIVEPLALVYILAVVS